MSQIIVQYCDILLRSVGKPIITFSFPPNDIAQYEVDSIDAFENLHSDVGVIKVEATGNKIKATELVRSFIEKAGTKIFVLYRLYDSAGNNEEKNLIAVYLTRALRKP